MKSTFFSIWGTAIVFTFLIASCQNESTSCVSLSESMQQAITSYITENNIDTEANVITTHWMISAYRTDVYITHTFQDILNNPNHIPTYYSTVADSIVVLIYTGTETKFNRNIEDIENEIRNLIIERSITLQPDQQSFTHTKTWLYSSCSDGTTLVREPTTKDLLYISCHENN
jgi:hypothetical protein